MPKKNKTACKRRKYQRCRGSRNQKNNNRRTRTIRRGGLPLDYDNFDYESLIAGTYPAKISALLTELTSAIAELKKYYYMIPPEYQDRINSSLQTVKSYTIEEFTPDVRESIVRTIANIKKATAECKKRNESNVLSYFNHLNNLKDQITKQEAENEPENLNYLILLKGDVKNCEEMLQKLPDSAHILKENYTLLDDGDDAD
jgi:hypothetical protein